MIAKIESGIKSMDETGSVSWIGGKFQMSQQIDGVDQRFSKKPKIN